MAWTPTVIVAAPDGKERRRLEGYLPKEDFQAFLEMGLARVAFMQKDFADAERRFTDLIDKFPGSSYIPEAVYWQGVSRYSGSHDHNALGDTAQTLTKEHPESQWAKRSWPWLPAQGSAA